MKAIIDAAIKRGSPWQGHHIFSYAQRVFGWAREQGTFGITSTPTDGRRPSKVIGAKTPRERVLTDEELRAVWNVSSKFDYPLGPFLRLLILTGQRRGEVANMRWREIDKCLWTVPVERMAEPPGRLTSAINSLSP